MISLFKSTPTGTELEAIEKVLKSGWWDKGPVVKEFEEKFAEFVGARYAVATNSCTAALEIAVQVADLPKICTVSPLTFISSALALYKADKKVVFEDINPKTLCTDVADIQVLYAGADYGIGKIYDMAHYGGGEHKGLVSCWSFQARKNLPTGDGGMITTNDPEIARKARALSWYGVDKSTFERSGKKYSWDYDVVGAGMKGNMNDLVAAIGLEHLKVLPERNKKRLQVAEWYNTHLSPEVRRPYPSKTWHMYVIRVKERDILIERLATNGIQSGVHYKPLYKYDIFNAHPLPHTEKAFKEIITLPMHTELTEEDIKKVCQVVNAHVSQL